MEAQLQSLLRWFWISLSAGAFYSVLYWLLSRRSDAWRRVSDAESAFWMRHGFPAGLANLGRGLLKSRLLLALVGGAALLFLVLTVVEGSMYLHFRSKLRQRPPPPARQHSERSFSPCFDVAVQRS
ncbi:MAG: hypothetical protein U1F98_02310 [Verrucomicrobiota bacterium]